MSLSESPLLGDSSSEHSDKICYEPSTDSSDGNTQSYLIYFLPGNPGMIQYYRPFLSRLHTLLSNSSSTEASKFHICGHSHRGFESTRNSKATGTPRRPLGLEQQIKDQEECLYRHINTQRGRTGNNPKVILMGHSVGCYMLLELIKEHRKTVEDGAEDFDLIGGILLFPTIMHIAKSPLGMVFGVCALGPLSSLQLNLAESENPPNTVFPGHRRHHREDTIVSDPGERSTRACEASHQIRRARSNHHYLVYQKPNGR